MGFLFRTSLLLVCVVGLAYVAVAVPVRGETIYGRILHAEIRERAVQAVSSLIVLAKKTFDGISISKATDKTAVKAKAQGAKPPGQLVATQKQRRGLENLDRVARQTKLPPTPIVDRRRERLKLEERISERDKARLDALVSARIQEN